MTEFPSQAARTAVAAALAEDEASQDVTTAWSVPEGLAAVADIRARQGGIASGLPVVAEVFAQVDPEVTVEALVPDGARLTGDDVLVRLSGSARSLITGERTVLNFLQRMGGIATLTDQYVQAVAGTEARILDTRKSAPGLRAMDKYAVTVGGGRNHRLNLASMVLLKENHIAAAGGVTNAIDAVRRGTARTGQKVETDVEVQTVAQAVEAISAGARWIMLDNMPVADIEMVVKIRAERCHAPGSGHRRVSTAGPGRQPDRCSRRSVVHRRGAMPHFPGELGTSHAVFIRATGVERGRPSYSTLKTRGTEHPRSRSSSSRADLAGPGQDLVGEVPAIARRYARTPVQVEPSLITQTLANTSIPSDQSQQPRHVVQSPRR
ncbi:carboxylating nicotinate-nucleotide diphosphorylase [Phytoactinopolyspora alkaliphila]|uniref:Nicotinate-nucleotide pyrophosphorylase [carboxylating] n=1 Tax=Phytoactinopolyspora alkaliphila TaxID=1783498 RepID=A0A6N9YQK8_9ACTN|nr:carboxylating nicotinate-nucleotide diphosphorylase [Phytoactinopolyspora alkaliphila]NED97109.1 carboxylating nicotinate-nucleotide diphosphorylase [Phytoactinopolyspora alkaliphila]